MADKLPKMILKRSGFLNRLIETVDVGNGIDNTEQESLFIVRATDSHHTYDEFIKIHNSIISLIADDDFETHDDVRRQADIAYYSIKARMARITESKLASATPAPVTPNPITTPKLQKITLPIFSGDFKTWSSFHDLYRTMVHENTTLSNVAKYQYMMTSLSGEPYHLLQGLPVTSDNYEIAYQTLKNRYQNKRHLATIYYNEIQNIHMKHEDSSKAYRLLIDTFTENLGGLKTLGFPVDAWDFLLLNILLQKLDLSIRTKFETEYSKVEIPTYNQLIEFLESHSKALESVKMISSSKVAKSSPSRPLKTYPATLDTENKQKLTNLACILCEDSHYLYQCSKFHERTPSQRLACANSHKLCKNCLSSRHTTNNCKSTHTCRVCNRRHHTLLHLNSNNLSPKPEVSKPSPPCVPETTAGSVMSSLLTVVLPVAEVEIEDCFGAFHRVRALIDSGSMINFITEELQNRLKIARTKHSIAIEGLNQMNSTCKKGSVICAIKPCNSMQSTIKFSAVVTSKICSKQPRVPIELSRYPHLRNLNITKSQLLPGSIDLLLGSELVPYILTGNRQIGKMDEPAALESVFGWLVMGKLTDFPPSTSNTSLMTEPSLDICMQKFWEVDQVKGIIAGSPEDNQCEDRFKSTYQRTETGRFMVMLPFRTTDLELGESYSQALHRFLSLEKRLIKASDIFEKYKQFMEDYLSTGHMSPVPKTDYSNTTAYYIPHHYVVNPNSSKLRVVFDASAKTSSGKSLNDILLTGPKLQRDLVSILINFRCFPIVFICDIKQMYRQILIVPHQRDFQRIIWKDYKTNELLEYRLNTVTYEVSSSPFLALRAVRELATIYSEQFPEASRVVLNDMYVDDIVTGSFSVQHALSLQQQIIKLLSLGGFELAKWASNSPELYKSINGCKDGVAVSLDQKEDGFIKVLGLHWDPQADAFGFSYIPRETPCSKRAILSSIARIYDPMGLITPCILAAKHLIQKLWLERLNWDDLPSQEIQNYWHQYKMQLPLLSKLKIPRQIQPSSSETVELHLFSDASSVGYCAVAYLRTVLFDNTIKLNFVYAKSRVAPLKVISIPRLELCGAVLLADLARFLMSSFPSFLKPKIFAWCDSMIVLNWLDSAPHRWKTFVANRIGHIQDIIPRDCWHHVPSHENPADPGSRGLLPADLVQCRLWWQGPDWLSLSSSNWPSRRTITCNNEALSEEKQQTVTHVTKKPDNFLITLLNRFSSLNKIKNITAYVLRFVSGCRKQNKHYHQALSIFEKQQALHTIAREVQKEYFSELYQQIKNNKLPAKQYRKLAPFISREKLLRVGGRLRNSELGFDTKHPILLPGKHRLSELIVEELHRQHLHPGFRTLSAIIANQFWILSPRNTIYKVLSRCINCFRNNPKSYTPIMADLPAFRVNQMKAFTTVGIDFAGPFTTTVRKHRGAKAFKSYLCIFVCAVTKAVHLELVTDLSSDAFLAALRRFVARRGRCIRIFSDRGTNFVGAYNQMLQIAQQAGGRLGIEWLFNPPAAPNFNGLTEAGVKSVKTHLKRVVGNQILTFEEFYTVLTQIESVLNSRPLCPLSSDPNDCQALTPGHFLVLTPLNTEIPCKDFQDTPSNRLSRWELLQKMVQHFWMRWSQEYLHTIQQRAKWNKTYNNISPGTLVIIRNECFPPLTWKFGRVEECFPGRDGVIRVVTVKTAHGRLQRPVSQLCPLPIEYC
ncbi:uncharacterized protein [Onthophagus taurus]|uniref:uncharacterized protein n=1 Tax=Onthophagus taurus TaxID=166361 RepID=UPI0039BEC079